MRYENIFQHFVYFSSSIVWTNSRYTGRVNGHFKAGGKRKENFSLINLCVRVFTCSTVCTLKIPFLVFFTYPFVEKDGKKWCVKDIELTNFMGFQETFSSKMNSIKDAIKIGKSYVAYYVRISAFFGCSGCTMAHPKKLNFWIIQIWSHIFVSSRSHTHSQEMNSHKWLSTSWVIERVKENQNTKFIRGSVQKTDILRSILQWIIIRH